MIPPTLQPPLSGHGHIVLSVPRSLDCRVVRRLIYQDFVSPDRCRSVPARRDRHFQHRARTTGVAHAPRITRRSVHHDGKQPPEGRGVRTLGSRLLRPYSDKRDSREGQIRNFVSEVQTAGHSPILAVSPGVHGLDASKPNHTPSRLPRFVHRTKPRQKKDESRIPRTARVLIRRPPLPSPPPSSIADTRPSSPPFRPTSAPPTQHRLFTFHAAFRRPSRISPEHPPIPNANFACPLRRYRWASAATRSQNRGPNC